MTKYVEVTKLMAGTPDKENIEIGKKYEVSEEGLTGVYVYANRGHKKYFLFNEQFKYVEQNEEEKEMTKYKYAKITKHAGHNDKRDGLEIGKTYKIVSYSSSLTDDCRIYLNEEQPHYSITEDQYELVEQEETQTFKTTIELKSEVQAKVDKLKNEAEHLLKKRNLLEQQARILLKKARKLNNVIKTIKEFE